MSVEQDFEDTVRICEFYAESPDQIEVDLENYHIMMDGYGVDPVMENGHLVCYLVEDPEGVTHFVGDLDSYFQSIFD